MPPLQPEVGVLQRGGPAVSEPVMESDLIVFRPAPGMPEGWLPEAFDGVWYERKFALPMGLWRGDFPATLGVASATGRFESRDDGAVAEVFEVGPPRDPSAVKPRVTCRHCHRLIIATGVFGWQHRRPGHAYQSGPGFSGGQHKAEPETSDDTAVQA